MVNPTLSFKDRAMALAASIALDKGMRGFVLASTGNAAVSAAAYAAAAGLECTVYAGSESHAGNKLSIAQSYGATVQPVEGDYSRAYHEAARSETGDWLNVTTTYRNPLLAEAYRPIAHELQDQVGKTPDVIVVPIGAGPLLAGIGRGYADLTRSGDVSRPPRLIGVQAEACAPLARAWVAGDWRASLAVPVPVRDTLAAAIADPLTGYEREGILTLEATRDSEGSIVAVDDASIEQARDWLATGCGLLVEPAAAAAMAALEHASVRRTLPDDATVVLLLTGHGSKEPSIRSAVT
jgi:threonine synthase